MVYVMHQGKVAREGEIERHGGGKIESISMLMLSWCDIMAWNEKGDTKEIGYSFLLPSGKSKTAMLHASKIRLQNPSAAVVVYEHYHMNSSNNCHILLSSSKNLHKSSNDTGFSSGLVSQKYELQWWKWKRSPFLGRNRERHFHASSPKYAAYQTVIKCDVAPYAVTKQQIHKIPKIPPISKCIIQRESVW